MKDSETTWLTSLRKDRDAWPQMLSSLGALFVLGAKPDWDAYDRPHRRRRVALPTYPFQRERHWLPVAPADSPANRRRRLVIRCWARMCPWPAVPVSMFGLERSAWNDVPGLTTTAYKGWR